MRMISLRVDSSIVFTLHRHVGAERCHGSGVTGQPFKTWLKDAPVLWRDSRPALMGQPYFHAGELPQQPSELFEDPVAGRTQPWIVGWQIHALLLSQSFAWMLKNVLLLDAGRTFDPQIHDSGEFICRQAFTPDQFQNAGLVARGPQHQLPCGRWGQQYHLESLEGFRPKLLDQGQPPADPALMPFQQLGDFDFAQSILA